MLVFPESCDIQGRKLFACEGYSFEEHSQKMCYLTVAFEGWAKIFPVKEIEDLIQD